MNTDNLSLDERIASLQERATRAIPVAESRTERLSVAAQEARTAFKRAEDALVAFDERFDLEALHQERERLADALVEAEDKRDSAVHALADNQDEIDDLRSVRDSRTSAKVHIAVCTEQGHPLISRELEEA